MNKTKQAILEDYDKKINLDLHNFRLIREFLSEALDQMADEARQEALEEAKEGIEGIWQRGDWQLETQYGENLLIKILDILKSGGKHGS